VESYQGKPQQFRGETGAQSSIIPTLDAFLSIQHQQDLLKIYLDEMRHYMPDEHRDFIETVENGENIRAFIQRNSNKSQALVTIYNACIEALYQFRSTHLKYAADYIQKQTQTTGNPTGIGTGGTPFMKYLKKHKDETLLYRLPL